MTSAIRFGTAALAISLACSTAWGQRAAATDHWVVTWASAQQQPRVAPPPRPPGDAPAAPSANTPPRPAPPPSSFSNQTIRVIARTSLGGQRLRVHLSNAFGTAPLNVGAAHVALRAKDSAITPGSDRTLMFNGAKTVVIPPGAEMLSDTVDLAVPKLADLAVSVYVTGDTGPASNHALALHTTYISKEGDFTGAADIADGTTSQAWYWVSSVDVMAPAQAAAIVTFGDSITDGATSTPNTDRSWPSILAQRLAANRPPPTLPWQIKAFQEIAFSAMAPASAPLPASIAMCSLSPA